MTTSKKDYIAVAGAIKEVREKFTEDPHSSAGPAGEAVFQMTIRLADIFEADNPSFDRFRFLEATHAEEVGA
jgi:hypothetical protein